MLLLQQVPGSELKDKLKTLGGNSGIDILKRLIEKGDGFCTVHESPGSLLIIPAGYICAVWCDPSADRELCCGIRWGYIDGSTTELNVIKTMLKQTIAVYPDMEPNYKPFVQQLEQYLLPAAEANLATV